MRNGLWLFIAGLLFGLALARATASVEAQSAMLGLGMNSGTVRPFAVNSSGNLSVVGN